MIVVALTAIASFAIPNEAFASVFRLLKFLTILAAAFFWTVWLSSGDAFIDLSSCRSKQL